MQIKASYRSVFAIVLIDLDVGLRNLGLNSSISFILIRKWFFKVIFTEIDYLDF